ncbi:Cationic amino acid transporter 1 [Linum perenne]
MLSVLCYSEFAVELPVAGGSYAYLRVELGDFVAYIAAGNILFEYIVAGASVARSWTSYFATLCNREPNSFRIYVRSMATDYNKLDPIAVGISSLVCVAASWSMKGSSRFNFITTIIHLVVLVFILAAGFTKANTQNISNFAPYGVRGVMKASAMLFFAYVGFDGVATLGEEVKNPGRDIPLGLIGSMTVVIIVYCLLAACLTMMQPYYQIDTNAAFSMAFKAVGMDWAKYIVAFGALKGMTTVLLANIIAQSRYFTHISRTHNFHTLHFHTSSSRTPGSKVLPNRGDEGLRQVEAGFLSGDDCRIVVLQQCLLGIWKRWVDWVCDYSAHMVSGNTWVTGVCEDG